MTTTVAGASRSTFIDVDELLLVLDAVLGDVTYKTSQGGTITTPKRMIKALTTQGKIAFFLAENFDVLITDIHHH